MASFVSHCIGNGDPTLDLGFDDLFRPPCRSCLFHSSLPPLLSLPSRVSNCAIYSAKVLVCLSRSDGEEATRKSDGDIDWMGSARTTFPLPQGYREGIPTTGRRKRKKEKKVGRRMTISPSTFLSEAPSCVECGARPHSFWCETCSQTTSAALSFVFTLLFSRLLYSFFSLSAFWHQHLLSLQIVPFKCMKVKREQSRKN